MASSSSSGESITANVTVTLATSTPSASGGPSRKSTVLSAAESCGCQANAVARTCYACLNQQITGQSCVINPFGTCMNYASALSYKSYFDMVNMTANESAIGLGSEFFWFKNATYCSSDDATCTNCRAKWIDAFQNQYRISNFSCVGASGCVCTAFCELRQLATFPTVNYSSGSETCYDRSGIAWSRTDQDSLMLVRNIITLLLGALMVAMAVRQIMTQYHQYQHDRRMRERRAALRQRDDTSRFDLMLTLEGWNGYREQLIERERESLRLKTEPLLSEAPTRVVIAEGEGFRPASPSQLAWQQHSVQES